MIRVLYANYKNAQPNFNTKQYYMKLFKLNVF